MLPADGVADFEAYMRDRGQRDFTVHPAAGGADPFVIQYIFPRLANIEAV